MNQIDEDYMTVALNLAKKGRGTTSPNPMVGAIIVKKNRIIGKGYHKKAGLLHAEIYALKEAGNDAKDATMYVTLEPCSHWGKTPPCTDAIIKAKLKRVIIGMKDPNPLVYGNGILKMQENGIEVEVGILEDKAKELNKFFIKYITKKIPYVIMKAAISLDGKIAVKTGDSKWISSNESRKRVQLLRNQIDAIMIGINTLKIDNPHLNVRIKNKKKEPYKIILAGKQKIRGLKNLNLFKENHDKIIIIQSMDAGNEIYEDLVHKIITLQENYTLKEVLKKLAKLEIISVLVEGGSRVFTNFIDEKLVDEYLFFIAPIIIGSDGIPIYQGKSPEKVKKTIKFTKVKGKFLNGNIFLELKR